MSELERLKAKLAAINEAKKDKNPICTKCGVKKIDDLQKYYRCAKHMTVFCEACLTIPVRDPNGNIYAKDQAHCREHFLYRQDCFFERI